MSTMRRCEVQSLSPPSPIPSDWKPHTDGEIKLDATAPTEPGVYAFAVDGIVMYVGLTNNSLRARFEQYRYGHESQRTNARVKKLISKCLSEGRQVRVLIATPEPLEWNSFPVDTAAGLEAGLIDMIRPEWNITGVA